MELAPMVLLPMVELWLMELAPMALLLMVELWLTELAPMVLLPIVEVAPMALLPMELEDCAKAVLTLTRDMTQTATVRIRDM